MPWIKEETWKAFSFDLCDPDFYVKLENVYLVLTQKHENRNFFQIKLAMRLSSLPLFDFVVWFQWVANN